MKTVQTFAIKPPPRSTKIFMWSVLGFLVAMMCVFIQAVPGMPALFIATFLPIIVIFAVVAMATRNTRFNISSKGLEITGGWCGQSLAWSELDVANARLVRFTAEPGLKPKWKTMGLAMPGCSAGWFRLYNKSKALIFLTDKNEAIYLPTRKEFSVLLSSTDNPALLEALKQFGKN